MNFNKEIMQRGYCGHFILCDCSLLSFHDEVDLIYIDPPFHTGAKYSVGNTPAYSDDMDFDSYIDMMRDILHKSYDSLADTGSIFVHVDYRVSAHIRLLLDEIFGISNFKNEIIWSYHSGGMSKNHFPRKHDNIYFYTKSDKAFFDINSVGQPRTDKRRNHMKKNMDTDGRVYFSINSHGKEYRYYEDDIVVPDDVWTDISHLQQKDSERVPYPHQKPLSLLERIITSSSQKDGTVCDFFSGSGTTAVASAELCRKWIACDNSPLAMFTLQKRLANSDICGTSIFEYGDCDIISFEADIKDNTARIILPTSEEVMYVSAGHDDNNTFVSCIYSDAATIDFGKENIIHVVTKSAKHGFYHIETK